jgi:hypothetical protein
MTRTIRRLALALALAPAGCGKESSADPAPLTAEEWKAIPVEKKYEPEALARLKAGDPALETAEGWEAFSRTTLAAARKKDFPKGKAK